ncbi:MAG: hypothetical protein PVH88_24200 [Ignavibacteria bacterium]|jgi:hypothetical protein
MKLYFAIALLFLSAVSLHSQEVEVFLIDSYITLEKPNTLILSFYTSEEVKSKLKLDNKYDYEISNELTDVHNFKLDISQLEFDSLYVPFVIYLETEDGKITRSEIFETALPKDYILNLENAPGFITVCCFGGVIFGLPSPTLVFREDKQFFGLSKEIPVVSFFANGFNYPVGYIGIEYGFVDGFEPGSFFRIGYKQIIQTPFLEYISPGVNLTSNLKGFNGVSPEISLGIVTIQNVFTLYGKYRYNTNLDDSSVSFHEISLGLYSNFFSINF